MKRRIRIVAACTAAVILLGVGVFGMSRVLTPGSELAVCSTEPVTVQGGDYFFREVSAGAVISEAQCLLNTFQPVRILALGESAPCTAWGETVTLQGDGKAVGNCDEGLILTRPALTNLGRFTHTTIWIELSASVARGRYADASSYWCAGGYVARAQPGFKNDWPVAQEELKVFYMRALRWIMQGMKLRVNNHRISDCETVATIV